MSKVIVVIIWKANDNFSIGTHFTHRRNNKLLLKTNRDNSNEEEVNNGTARIYEAIQGVLFNGPLVTI